MLHLVINHMLIGSRMKSNMNIQILSRDLIKPSTSTLPSFRNYKISLVDELSPLVNIPTIFYYPSNYAQSADHKSNNCTTDDSRCNILRKSLSKALTKFYPFAGRYLNDSHLVDCSDQGAEFVVAKVDCSLDNILRQRTNLKAELLNDLLPRPIGAAGEITDPLLAIQVNVFACGGLAIAVCSFHKIADMASTSSFVKAWADIAAEQDETIIPSNLDSALLFPGKGLSGLPLGISRDKENIQVHKIATKLFPFSEIAISRIQEKAKLNSSSKKSVSRLQSVCGIIGKAIIDMQLAIPGSPKGYIVSQSVNIRERTFPTLPKNQFGNLYVVATAQSVAGEKSVDFQTFVHLLSDSIKRSTDRCEKLPSLGEEGQMIITQGFGELIQGVLNPEINLGGSFTSWCKFPFYESDFGWGKPVWVSSVNVPVKNMIILIDDKSGEGIEAWVSLDENEMPKFEQDCSIIEFTT